MIGLYGPIFFQSGSTNLCTFDGMKKTVTARFGSHEVWMDKPMLEYSGPQLIEIAFTMELITPFTVDPLTTVIMLEEIMDLATPLPLVIGMKPMGRGMSLFVLTSLSHQPKYFYRSGQWMGCSVDVQLKEYPNITLSNLIQALGGAANQTAPSDVSAQGASQPDTSADAAANSASTYTPQVQVAQNLQNPPNLNQTFNITGGYSPISSASADPAGSMLGYGSANTPLPSESALFPANPTLTP
jgi:phage protein U